MRFFTGFCVEKPVNLSFQIYDSARGLSHIIKNDNNEIKFDRSLYFDQTLENPKKCGLKIKKLACR